MGPALACSTGDGKEAKFIVGNADTGEQQFLCPDDMATFGLVFALTVMHPDEVIEAANLRKAAAASDGEGKPADKPARKTAAKATTRKPKGVRRVAGEGGQPPPSQQG